MGGTPDVRSLRMRRPAPSRCGRASGCALGDWYHVAVTYDGSGKAAGVTVSLNGERLGLEVVRDTLAGPVKSDGPLRLGSKGAREAVRRSDR